MEVRKILRISDVRRIKKMYKMGMSIRKISIFWGIPYATLYRELKGRTLLKKLTK